MSSNPFKPAAEADAVLSTTEDSFAKRVDSVAKVSSLILLLLYGIGYFTTSLYFAHLGIPLASPFRPKVIAAGFIYVVLSAPFLWLSLKLFSPLNLMDSARQHYAALISTAALFFFMCAIASMLASPIFNLTSAPTSKQSLTYISLCVLAGMMSPRSAKRILSSWQDKHPLLSSLASAVLLLMVVSCVLASPYFAPAGFGVRKVALWFFAVGILPWGLVKRSRFADQSTEPNWAIVSIQLLIMAGMFPVTIYPHVKAEWGGGQPVDATILFSRNSGLHQNSLLKVKIISEDEYGFYYCQNACEQSTFSPRESVAAVIYAKNSARVFQ